MWSQAASLTQSSGQPAYPLRFRNVSENRRRRCSSRGSQFNGRIFGRYWLNRLVDQGGGITPCVTRRLSRTARPDCPALSESLCRGTPSCFSHHFAVPRHRNPDAQISGTTDPIPTHFKRWARKRRHKLASRPTPYVLFCIESGSKEIPKLSSRFWYSKSL